MSGRRASPAPLPPLVGYPTRADADSWVSKYPFEQWYSWNSRDTDRRKEKESGRETVYASLAEYPRS